MSAIKPGSWRSYARQVIDQVLGETTELPPKERLKRIDAAYPFGSRANHPYQQWLKERRTARERLGLVPKVSASEPSELPTIAPSRFQRLQLASLIAIGDEPSARIYMTNQTAQGGTDWSDCAEAAPLLEQAKEAGA